MWRKKFWDTRTYRLRLGTRMRLTPRCARIPSLLGFGNPVGEEARSEFRERHVRGRPMARGTMKLLDIRIGLMECRVCGERYLASIKPSSGGRYYRGSRQCRYGCTWDEYLKKKESDFNSTGRKTLRMRSTAPYLSGDSLRLDTAQTKV